MRKTVPAKIIPLKTTEMHKVKRVCNGAQALVVYSLVLGLLLIFAASCAPMRKASVKQEAKQTTRATEQVLERRTETIRAVEPIKADTIRGQRPAADIIKGRPLIIENANVRAELRFNPGTGNIEATAIRKANEVPVEITRVVEREEERGIEERREASHEQRAKERDEASWPKHVIWALWLLVFLLALIVIYWVFRRFGIV